MKCMTALMMVALALVGCAARAPEWERPFGPQRADKGWFSWSGFGGKACSRDAKDRAAQLPLNMRWVRMGSSFDEVAMLLGAERERRSVLLDNGATVDVVFYDTAQTVCTGGDEGAMPLVFRDDRLIGVGWSYYRAYVVTSVRKDGVVWN